MTEEGCAPVRRGLKEHISRLGPIGVTLYLFLLLDMDPVTRSVDIDSEDLCEALGTGKTQVSRTLAYLERHSYIDYERGNRHRKSRITVLKPECPETGHACPLASSSSPCSVLASTVRLTAEVVRAEKPAEDGDGVADRILAAWNDAKVIRHKALTSGARKQIARVLVDRKEAEVIEAIRNYGLVLAMPDPKFTYRYTLEDFLGRKQGHNLTRFSNEADPVTNFGGVKRQRAADPTYADL
jgi:hypothetical protein